MLALVVLTKLGDQQEGLQAGVYHSDSVSKLQCLMGPDPSAACLRLLAFSGCSLLLQGPKAETQTSVQLSACQQYVSSMKVRA